MFFLSYLSPETTLYFILIFEYFSEFWCYFYFIDLFRNNLFLNSYCCPIYFHSWCMNELLDFNFSKLLFIYKKLFLRSSKKCYYRGILSLDWIFFCYSLKRVVRCLGIALFKGTSQRTTWLSNRKIQGAILSTKWIVRCLFCDDLGKYWLETKHFMGNTKTILGSFYAPSCYLSPTKLQN